ncbi:MAG: alanine racemase [Rhizobiaceae bacterium]
MTFPVPAGAALTVDLGALADNWRLLDRRAGARGAASVVKADAYGLGADFVTAALRKAGCRTFFVAYPDEGLALKPYADDAEILVLNAISKDGLAVCRDRGLTPVLNSTVETGWWLDNGREQPAALMVDTGMSRLGLTPTEALICAGRFRPRLLMSHLACADETGHRLNRQQIESFQAVRRAFADVDSSLANSAGHFLDGADFDLTRAGIALYGGAPLPGEANPMRNVATLTAIVTQVRRVAAGTSVSYGATAIMSRDTLIAVTAIGYADGVPRSASGSGVPARADGSRGGQGAIGGRLVPIRGRVTMDTTLFDVTDCTAEPVKPGDRIELFGAELSLDDAATAAGTISYELLTGIGRRVERRYTIGTSTGA